MVLDLNRLREIGFAEWDPIELMRARETWVGTGLENEYDSYLIRVADRLIAGDEDAELVAYLVTVESEDMGGAADCSKARATATVAAIKAHLGEAIPERDHGHHGLKELVESRFPGWRVVEYGHREPQRQDRFRLSAQEQVGALDVEALKTKWFGPDTKAPEDVEREKMTGQVVIEPIGGGGTGRKTIVIRNGKIIGAQG
jgi:hypothetical protein